MGSTVYPQSSSSGGIKSVQRGLASSSGNITITSVNISKSFVTIYGTTSSGTVAASGSVSTSGNLSSSMTDRGMILRDTNVNSASIYYPSGATREAPSSGATTDFAAPARLAYYQTLNSTGTSNQSGNLSGGSNNLVAAVVQGYLQDSTTLVVSGACRWEVVAFN